MFAGIAAVLFATFVGNVAWGALSSASPLNNVQEMLVLFAACCCFVIVVLQREAKEKAEAKTK